MHSHETKPFLAIDIGTVNTRALLFDLVEGRYQLLGVGTSITGNHLTDISHGIRQALRRLPNQADRSILPSDDILSNQEEPDTQEIQPEVPFTAATFSTGRLLKVLLVGAFDEITLQNLRHLVQALPVGQVEVIDLYDSKKLTDHLELWMRLRPDLVLATSGLEDGEPRNLAGEQSSGLEGNSPALLKLFQVIPLACKQIPESERPEILFTGRRFLQADLERLFQKTASMPLAGDICPPFEIENFEAVLEQVSQAVSRLRTRQHPALVVQPLSENEWQPASVALRRIVRFINTSDPSEKHPLAVDINPEKVTLASGSGDMSLTGLVPHWISTPGVGNNFPQGFHFQNQVGNLMTDLSMLPDPWLGQSSESYFESLLRWSGMPLSKKLVMEYVYNKAAHPTSLPFSKEELAIEKAIVTLAMQVAIKQLAAGGRNGMTIPLGLKNPLEPILATGNFERYTENPGQAMLILLDGLQPAGITTLILDRHHVLATLGAIAPHNPNLAVQLLESNAFLHLGTVVAPVGKAKPGSPVLRITLEMDDGKKSFQDVSYGAVTVLPLDQEQPVHLHLQPLQRFDIGMGGAGIGGSLRIAGGSVGLVVDARGRPLRLPDDPYQRQDVFQKWHTALNSHDTAYRSL